MTTLVDYLDPAALRAISSLELVARLVDFGALLSDDHAWTSGVQRHDDLARLPLDDDVGNGRVAEARLEILAQQLVFTKQRRQLASRVVA